eukprot:EG_transcript_6529
MQAAGLLWDISIVRALVGDYFLIMSSNASIINKPIDAAVAAATSQLAVVRANLINQSALRGAATLAYMNNLVSSDVQRLQVMQDNFLTDFQALKASSEALLTASQVRGSSDAYRASDAQSREAVQLKADQIRKMNTTAGLTIGVVFGILLVVVCLSTWGTVRLTAQLSGVISLMEDVAHMRVENLSIPQQSSVQDVARIQTAFQLVVERLAEYKSYIPASVFAQLGGVRPVSPSSRSVADLDNSVSLHDEPVERGLVAASPSIDALPRCDSSRSWQPSHAAAGLITAQGTFMGKRHVAVLCVNVRGFVEGFCDDRDWVGIFNEYVVCLHKASFQALGNVDFLMGDQVFVTFNAFVACPEQVRAAGQVAFDAQRLLTSPALSTLKFQLGLSFGSAVCSAVGYAKFKTMVTLGTPMKTASLLSQVDGFENAVMLADASFRERAKRAFDLQPVDLLNLPWKESSTSDPRRHRVFKVLSKKDQEQEEWLYAETCASDWDQTFDKLVAAPSSQAAHALLREYLADHPKDAVALRLTDHLHHWFPHSR